MAALRILQSNGEKRQMVAIQDRAGIRPGRPKSTVAEADPEEQSGGGGEAGGDTDGRGGDTHGSHAHHRF